MHEFSRVRNERERRTHRGEETWGERKAPRQGKREAPLGIIDLAHAHYIGDIICLVLQVS
jgi:hypothetical protein